MHGVIVASNSTGHNGQLHKVRITKTGIMITHNRRHIKKMPIRTEQYLREEIVKSAGHLRDISTNTDQVKQDRIFNHIQLTHK